MTIEVQLLPSPEDRHLTNQPPPLLDSGELNRAPLGGGEPPSQARLDHTPYDERFRENVWQGETR